MRKKVLIYLVNGHIYGWPAWPCPPKYCGPKSVCKRQKRTNISAKRKSEAMETSPLVPIGPNCEWLDTSLIGWWWDSGSSRTTATPPISLNVLRLMIYWCSEAAGRFEAERSRVGRWNTWVHCASDLQQMQISVVGRQRPDVSLWDWGPTVYRCR